MYDAVHLFAKALHDLDTSQQIDVRPLSCEAEDTWPHGYSLINYMKIVSGLPSFSVKTFYADVVRNKTAISSVKLDRLPRGYVLHDNFCSRTTLLNHTQ